MYIDLKQFMIVFQLAAAIVIVFGIGISALF